MSLRNLLLACTLVSSAGAAAQTLDPLTKIAQNTVFAGCSADHVADQPGTNFANTPIEPFIAADPTTPGHLLAGVQQDRWTNGGSRGLRGAVSGDGGASWYASLPAGITQCTGGVFPRASDPWVSFGPDGIAYFSTLAFFNDTDTAYGRSAILTSRSTDGAVTWNKPVALIDDRDPLATNDKNSVTADPNVRGVAYSVWDRLYGPASAFRAPGGSDEHGSDAAAARPDSAARAKAHAARLRAAARGAADVPPETFGPSYFSRTVDGGRTWSRAVPIYDPGPNAQTIGNIVTVLPSGEVLDFFTKIDPVGNLSIGTVRSIDRGQFFTAGTTITDIQGFGSVSPETQQGLRDASLLFSVAVDPHSGALYVVWEDNRFDPTTGPNGIEAVLFTQSLDKGLTWSRPAKINRTPTSTANVLRGQAFTPTVAVAGDGTIVVTYYDFRHDTGAGGFEGADAFAIFCTPGHCTSPTAWGRERRLTPHSFNIVHAPSAGGLFLGDYMGLVAQGQDIYPAFTTVTGVNKTALWTRPIHLPAVVN